MSAIEGEDVRDEVAILLSRMQRRTWFVAISEDVAGGPPVAEHLLKHLRAQIALERAGVLVAAGPLTGPDGVARGGMTVLRCADRDEARGILDDDPLHAAGARRYDLHTWQVNEGSLTVTVRLSDGTGGLDR